MALKPRAQWILPRTACMTQKWTPLCPKTFKQHNRPMIVDADPRSRPLCSPVRQSCSIQKSTAIEYKLLCRTGSQPPLPTRARTTAQSKPRSNPSRRASHPCGDLHVHASGQQPRFCKADQRRQVNQAGWRPATRTRRRTVWNRRNSGWTVPDPCSPPGPAWRWPSGSGRNVRRRGSRRE